jgi:uncharacterized Ntn-hydrolase superfamily protein
MTYSIVARDPTTSELGVAVQSRYFAAGRLVPWIEAGVGAFASQAFASPVYGHEGLRLLRSGMSPEAALDKLLSQDPGRAQRQVGIIDGRGASRCTPARSAWLRPVTRRAPTAALRPT